jgi:hypothetical protein
VASVIVVVGVVVVGSTPPRAKRKYAVTTTVTIDRLKLMKTGDVYDNIKKFGSLKL